MKFQPLYILWIILISITVGLLRPGVALSGDVEREYQLKAGFLVNFARFITWPENAFASPDADIIICIMGENPFGNALEGARKKKIGSRGIQLIYVDSLAELPKCHLLYVSKSEENAMQQLHLDKTRPMVTVSDIQGFAKTGGGIEFVTRSSKLSFIINNSAIKERQVQVRASLLKLAETVY